MNFFSGMSQKVLICLGACIPKNPWGSGNDQHDPCFPKLTGIQTLVVEFITLLDCCFIAWTSYGVTRRLSFFPNGTL